MDLGTITSRNRQSSVSVGEAGGMLLMFKLSNVGVAPENWLIFAPSKIEKAVSVHPETQLASLIKNEWFN
jgi:hypothetical protein